MELMSLEIIRLEYSRIGLRYFIILILLTALLLPAVTFTIPTNVKAQSRQNNAPTAVIDSPENANQYAVGEIVTFDASSSSDPDNDPLTYAWNFGDGNTGYGVKTTHVYEFPWVPIVTLTVDDGTLNDTARVVIIIGTGGGQNRPPRADINSPSNGDTFSVEEEIIFDGSNSSDLDEDELTYFWDFGDDNTTSGMIVIHYYSETGPYIVTLTVSDGMFNDSQRIVIFVNNTPPIADAGEDQVGYLGEELVFDGSNSSDPDRRGSIINYTWELGDWSVKYGASILHSYLDYGTYVVTLTVTDDDGATSTDQTSAVITNAPPVAVLKVTTEDTIVGEEIEFDASASYDTDGSVEQYYFNFGDGTESDWITEGIVTHRYFDVDEYDVTLRVRDNMDEPSEPVAVVVDITKKINQPPTVSISSPLPNDQVAGEIIIRGSAQDPDSNVMAVAVKIDSGDWVEANIYESRANTIGWEYYWDTEIIEDGEHIITARAWDGKKYSEENSIKVKVNNRPTTFIEITEKLDPTTCLPSEEIEILGVAQYDTKVPVKNTDVEIEIVETGNAWTVKTDAQGRYSDNFKAPNEPGAYTVTVFITDGTLQHSNSKDLTVLTPPDLFLKPEDITFRFSGDKPVSKEMVRIVATIHNSGDTAAKGTVSFYEDALDRPFQSLNINVPKKGSVLVQSNWPARAGKHTISVEISNVGPEESEPGNNRASKEITVEESGEEEDEKAVGGLIDSFNNLPRLYRYSIIGVIIVIILLIIIYAAVRSSRKKKTEKQPGKQTGRTGTSKVVFKTIDEESSKEDSEKTLVKFEAIGLR